VAQGICNDTDKSQRHGCGSSHRGQQAKARIDQTGSDGHTRNIAKKAKVRFWRILRMVVFESLRAATIILL
jgi:hypothetical protein